jgi:CubicO group peptidase (beta-lactamase class C family)
MDSTGAARPRNGVLILLAIALAGCADVGSEGDAGAEQQGVTLATASTAHVPTSGLDSVRMEDAVRRASELPRLRTLLVSRHGEMQLERRFRGPALDAPANVKSVSKSVLSALVGIAIAEGHLEGPDQSIAAFFPQQLGRDDDLRKREITTGQLLSMQSGLERTSGANYGRWVTSRDWVGYVLSRPMVSDPGSQRIYSTGNSHLLSAILTKATGQSTWAFARDRLSDPLGMTLPRWPADPQGIYFGGNEMRLSPRAMVRFGEIYRNGGRHEGRQIVPESWIRESLTSRASARGRGEGYGYGWFLSEVRGYPMFYAWGYGGQFIFVIPALEMTVVTTSDPEVERERDHLRAVRSLLSDWIVPAAETGARGDDRVVVGQPRRPSSSSSFSWMPPNPPLDITSTTSFPVSRLPSVATISATSGM